MKTIVIREFGNYMTTDALCFDIEKLNIKLYRLLDLLVEKSWNMYT